MTDVARRPALRRTECAGPAMVDPLSESAGRLAELPAAVELLQRLGENANVQGIAARRDAGMPAFIARIRAHHGAAS